eukprot:scaffold1503_cov120-Isochrysis_galbana.AAC.6
MQTDGRSDRVGERSPSFPPYGARDGCRGPVAPLPLLARADGRTAERRLAHVGSVCTIHPQYTKNTHQESKNPPGCSVGNRFIGSAEPT